MEPVTHKAIYPSGSGQPKKHRTSISKQTSNQKLVKQHVKRRSSHDRRRQSLATTGKEIKSKQVTKKTNNRLRWIIIFTSVVLLLGGLTAVGILFENALPKDTTDKPVTFRPSIKDVLNNQPFVLPLLTNVDICTTSAVSEYQTLLCERSSSGRTCTFDVGQCSDGCVLGYKQDDFNCAVSCDCALQGVLESDVAFSSIDVQSVLSTYITEEDSTFLQEAHPMFNTWDQYKALGRYKIPYIIAPNVDMKALDSINTASKEISMKTCVDFYRRASEIDYVEFIKQGHSCVSNVGRVGGRQVVSLKGKCSDHGMLVHQMLHVIGMWHEQSRHDRDQYVTINIDNVNPENRFNFKKRGRGSTVGKYDKTSIMHLDGYVFSSNQQPTIVDKTSGYAVVAQRTKLTDLDVAKINQLYQCPNNSDVQRDQLDHWGEWGSWQECSASCDRGERVRTRQCVDDSEHEVWFRRCGNEYADVKSCEMGACLAGAWGAWSSCTATCGDGVRHRQACCYPGEKYQTEICGVTFCVQSDWIDSFDTESFVDWSPWQLWGECSRTCGSGFRKRSRHCEANNAVVADEKCARGFPGSAQVEFCATKTCGILEKSESTWSVWGRWTPCSVSCGSGTQSRSRTCNGGDLCFGDDTETRPCDISCDYIGKWSGWSLWTTCPEECVGTRSRQRSCYYLHKQLVTTCVGGTNSVGKHIEEQKCRLEVCKKLSYGDDSGEFMTSEWGTWGNCSKPCLGGTQWRVRSCLSDSCSVSLTEGRVCNAHECYQETTTSEPTTAVRTTTVPPSKWGDWVIMTKCKPSCGPGLVTLQRNCFNATYHVANNCGGGSESVQRKTEPCEIEECPVWGEWSSWGVCQGDCVAAHHTRTRVCNTTCCEGPSIDIATCEVPECIFTEPVFNTSATYWATTGPCTGAGRYLTGDVNGDGLTDIMCLELSGYALTQLSLGNGSFGDVIDSYRRGEHCANYMQPDPFLADLNADGLDDLVCHVYGTVYFLHYALPSGALDHQKHSWGVSGFCTVLANQRIVPGFMDSDLKKDFFCHYINPPAETDPVWYIHIKA